MVIYELFIDGSLVLASPGAATPPPTGSVVSLETFSRGYDEPSSLVLRVDGDWRTAAYPADAVVDLRRDGVIVFQGLLDVPRPVLSTSSYPGMRYTAYDLCRALDGPTALTESGSASVRLSSGPLSSVVDQFLLLVADILTEKGVSDECAYVGGAGAIQALPVSLDAASIDDGFRQIAAAAPGVRVFLSPDPAGDLPKYTFVNLFGSPTHDLVMDETRVPELNIYRSLDGRAGAVKTLEGVTQGSADVEITERYWMVPAWDASLESRWTWHDAGERDNDGAETELSAVHRRFSFAAFTDAIGPDTPMGVEICSVWDDTNSRWRRVTILSLDWEARTLTLVLPALRQLGNWVGHRFNPNEPGRAKGATVRLCYSLSGAVGTPIFIQSVRHPATGFAGPVFDLAPMTCGYEAVITVPAGVNTEAYVRDAHTALSQPVTVGSIPLDEDLPADLWYLDRRLNITTASHGETGFEDLGAPLMGIRVAFAGGVSAVLEMEKDPSILLREGS